MGVLTGRLTRKRVVSAAVAVPALVLLLATTRTWLTGRSAEPLLGGGTVSATGAQLAPGVVALALVCLVALVTTLTGGPAVRRVSCLVLVLAAAGTVAHTVRPLTGPEEALGRVAAAGLGRTGVVATSAEVSAWAWTAPAAGILLLLAALLAAVAARQWSGLSSRFDAPGDEGDEGGAVATSGRGPRARAAATERGTHPSTWDDLSEGRDPTIDAAEPHTPSSATDQPADRSPHNGGST
ncbi:MAG: Trp biosynthesis-associated membrane protein [Lapillicoccus sp.]